MTGHLTVVYQSRNEGHGTIWFDFDAEFLGWQDVFMLLQQKHIPEWQHK